MPHEQYSAILVVNPYGIGDVLHTTPLLCSLRKNFPHAYIAALLGSRTYDILRYNRDVDEIFTFDKGRFDRENKLRGIATILELVGKLKGKKFGLLIDLSNAPEYAFFAEFFLGIPRRIGFNHRGRGRFLTDKLPLVGFSEKHVVEYYLDIARRLGLQLADCELKLETGDGDKKWASDFLKINGIKEKDKLIAIVPGGGASWGANALYRHWPAENFAKVADGLLQRFEAKILLLGDDSEKNICDKVSEEMSAPAINACGKTSLLQFAALLANCRLAIANDGGPLHIAVSQGVATIAVFGPVDVTVYGQYPPSERHVVCTAPLGCRPCYKNFKLPPCQRKECLSMVTPDEVLAKARL